MPICSLCLSLRSAIFSTHRDFQVCEGDSYSCKWFTPLSKVEAVETDYNHDIWDYIVARGQRSNNGAKPICAVYITVYPMNAGDCRSEPEWVCRLYSCQCTL